MFGTSTFATIWNSAIGDTTYMVTVILTAIVTGMIALAGLGFGIRLVLHKITGKKLK